MNSLLWVLSIMSLRTEQANCQGLAGNIQFTVDHPAAAPIGWALALHPHPLYGGTRDNKVVTTAARACVQRGLLTFRPNFRGVGASDGQFDKAVGETADMVALVEHILQTWPEATNGPWILSGFSFGTAVAAQLYAELADKGLPLPGKIILIGCAVERFRYRELQIPANTLLIHGEADDVVPITEGIDFARQHELSLSLVPDAGHFFHGKLLILREVIDQAVAACFAPHIE